MSIHREHILTTTLREAYSYLLEKGERDRDFDVEETGPHPKRSVRYRYAGRSTQPFAFIVNSGERKDYHLFYIRHPRAGDQDRARQRFGANDINENPAGELTLKIRNRQDAEKVWELVKEIQLK